MKVNIVDDNSVVITPPGRIDISNSHELKEKMLDVYDKGYNELVIDFSNVSAIDSSGLGKMLLLQKRLKERGGELVVKNVKSQYVRKMFTMIHLEKVITIID